MPRAIASMSAGSSAPASRAIRAASPRIGLIRGSAQPDASPSQRATASATAASRRSKQALQGLARMRRPTASRATEIFRTGGISEERLGANAEAGCRRRREGAQHQKAAKLARERHGGGVIGEEAELSCPRRLAVGIARRAAGKGFIDGCGSAAPVGRSLGRSLGPIKEGVHASVGPGREGASTVWTSPARSIVLRPRLIRSACRAKLFISLLRSDRRQARVLRRPAINRMLRSSRPLAHNMLSNGGPGLAAGVKGARRAKGRRWPTCFETSSLGGRARRSAPAAKSISPRPSSATTTRATTTSRAWIRSSAMTGAPGGSSSTTAIPRPRACRPSGMAGCITPFPNRRPRRRFRGQSWEKDHLPNMTGTLAAWRPKGSILREGERPAATGDYEAWTPD